MGRGFVEMRMECGKIVILLTGGETAWGEGYFLIFCRGMVRKRASRSTRFPINIINIHHT
jgi:hypothetical protein